MMAYSGGFARWASGKPPILVPTVPETDPQHLHPVPDPNISSANPWEEWQPQFIQPELPVMMDGGGVPEQALAQGSQLIDHAPWVSTSTDIGTYAGPVQSTHEYGTGPQVASMYGTDEHAIAQDPNQQWAMTDDGSMAAHAWVPMRERSGPNVTYWQNQADNGEVPPDQTVLRYVKGHDTVYDPYARVSKTLRRWDNHPMAMHRYDSHYNPKRSRAVRSPVVQPAMEGSGPNMSPFPGNIYNMGATQYSKPQPYRAPQGWQESQTSDGTANAQPANLGLWSL
jgi:hypothetical protein